MTFPADVPLTHVSLFSGIGGIDLAAHWAGFETIQFVEKDEFCQKVLAKNFPGVPIHDDITTFDGKPFRGRTDLVSGGFPCQDVSDAGLRDKGIEGERSGLFSQIMRLVCEIRPRFILMENVSGLLSRGMGTVLGELASIGCDAEWQVLSAAGAGAPHRRRRVFIVAYPKGKRWIQDEYEVGMGYEDGCGAKGVREHWGLMPSIRLDCFGHSYPNVPRNLRVDNGLPPELVSNQLRALGNAVVPAQVFPILKAIADQLRQQSDLPR